MPNLRVDAKPAATQALDAKERHLSDILSGFESVIVAFSGGADSAYLAHEATRVLGARALAVTADSPSYPDAHRQLARRVAGEFHIAHEIIRTREIERPEYRANPANRCYYCKQELYQELSAIAAARGFGVVVDGSNADDRGDYRPGRQAAREHGVRSPLDEADLSKDEIRLLSRQAGLPTWDVPASACLSSRIPYGSEVTEEKLRMIEARRRHRARRGFPRVPRSPSRHARAPGDRQGRNGACPRPASDRTSRASRSARSATVTSPSICRDTAWAASTKRFGCDRSSDARARLAALALACHAGAPAVPAGDARGYRLGELRARCPRLRCRQASAASARLSRLHRARKSRRRRGASVQRPRRPVRHRGAHARRALADRRGRVDPAPVSNAGLLGSGSPR